jgi:hypothetical protein
MKRFIPVLEIIFCAGIFCGCANMKNSPPPIVSMPNAKKIELRNNAVSLLYDLLNDEKNVSKILIIKSNSDELGRLIKAISVSSDDAQKQLDALAKTDPTLKLHALELPAGEKATRDAIAKTKEHELLFSSGENFEFNLLLTQADALSYGWHLAKIAAENSSQPQEVREFNSMSVAMQDLYKQAVAMMRTPSAK